MTAAQPVTEVQIDQAIERARNGQATDDDINLLKAIAQRLRVLELESDRLIEEEN